MKTSCLTIAGREYGSRLIIGTGKYASFQQTREALDASGAEIITVAVRRINIFDRSRENLLDHLDLGRVSILPNTAGCSTAQEAMRTAMLAREDRKSTRLNSSHRTSSYAVFC